MPFPSPTVERIDGCRLAALECHPDDRGSVTEIFREQWADAAKPLQWNLQVSRAGVLRGVHVHPTHDDYLVLAAGEALIGLRDLRRDSPTFGVADTVGLRAEELSALSIPHGVAHGFWFPVPATLFYGLTHYWNPDDELGCRWDDPALEIPWPEIHPVVSARDESAESFSQMLAALDAALALQP